jgi:ornithine--oxo-acid transaminase
MSNVHRYQDEQRRNVAIIGVASGIGASDHGCGDGPGVLEAIGIAEKLRSAERDASWTTTISALQDSGKIAVVADCASRTASAVAAAVAANDFPVVIGGDHSCAIGTWRGVAQAMAGKPLGLLWIDAHLDSRTPETSHSGALHGMPLACLLGAGPERLTNGTQPLQPHQIAVIGARRFEADEDALLKGSGVRVFFMDEIARRGLDAVMQDALTIVQCGTAGFGLSVNVDAIDPRDAPGVSTPSPSGLRATELVSALALLRNHPGLLALEIAEYDPYRDEDGKTARVVTDLLTAVLGAGNAVAEPMIALERRHGARNYDPLPVVLAKGKGVYLWDEEGRRYLDMMSAYSAVSLGHAHPRILEVLTRQAGELAVTSRAYHNNRLPRLLQRLCQLTGLDQALPVNTGLEAVETAIKAARKWAYQIKGVPADYAEIIACEGNFHGRSTTIVAMSSEPQYKDGFGPYPPGFKRIPFGDSVALARAITPNTAAFLVEPVQGEAGIIVPPQGYLAECARICRENNVLLICDEVQTGLGRTGRFLACEHESVHPDGVILGKALGGGVLPVSAFVARREVMQVFKPGDHGSTFGGNPLAAAVALEALSVIVEERLAERSAKLGRYLLSELRCMRSPLIREVRGMGLFIGMEIDPVYASARQVCDRLMARGILTKDTHGTVVRFAPPLIVTREQLNWALQQIRHVLNDWDSELKWVA